MEIQERNSLEISPKLSGREVTIVGRGIKIEASEKPISASFTVNWGRVYIALDCSRSMKGKYLNQARLGIWGFAKDAFKKGYLVGLIKFSDKAEHLCEPTNDISILQNCMQEVRASGGTNMTDAITLAHSMLKKFTGTRAVVIATDGMPDDVETSLRAARLAKVGGIDILTIGTDCADQEFLKKLASRAELSARVSGEMFAQAISNASLLLTSPRNYSTRIEEVEWIG
jgi:uncharacterized protein YegL